MKQLPQEWMDAGQESVSHSRLEKPPCLRMFEYLYLKDERRDIPVGVYLPSLAALHMMPFRASYVTALIWKMQSSQQ